MRKALGLRQPAESIVPARAEQDGWGAWNAWCDGRIDAAIAAEHEYMLDVIGTAIGEERGDLRDDIREALHKLRAEFAEKIAELRGELMGRIAAIDPAATRAAKGEAFRFASEKSAGDDKPAELPRSSRTVN